MIVHIRLYRVFAKVLMELAVYKLARIGQPARNFVAFISLDSFVKVDLAEHAKPRDAFLANYLLVDVLALAALKSRQLF